MNMMFNHEVIEFEVEKVPLYQYDGSHPTYDNNYQEIESDVG